MATTAVRPDTTALVVRLRPAIELDEDQFFEFCQLNRDIRIERNAEGDLELMPPTDLETGGQNAVLTAQVTMWALRDGTGRAFDSSTGFRLPNGAVRSPDASWVLRSRLETVSPQKRGKAFLPLCPDFAVELRSPSDRLRAVQAKMREYMENGARLGWLLDPVGRRVHIYRPDAEVEALDDPSQVSAEPELPGFALDLRLVWGIAS